MNRSRTYLPVHSNQNGGKVTITIEMACDNNTGEAPSPSRPFEKYIELNLPEIDSTSGVNTRINIRNNIMSRVRDELDKIFHIQDFETTDVPPYVASTSPRIGYDGPSTLGNRSSANLNVLRDENTALRMQLHTLDENMEYLHKIYGTRISSLEDQIRIGVAESVSYGSNLELLHNSELLNTKGVLENVFKQLYDVQKAMCAAAKTKFDAVDALVLSIRDESECLNLQNELDTTKNVLVTLRRDADDHEREINSRYQHVKRLINMNRFEELVYTSFVTSVVNDPPDILMDIVRKLLGEVTDGARLHDNNESSLLSTKLLLEKVYKEIFDIQKDMCEEAKSKFDSVDAVILTARDEVECMNLLEKLDETATIVGTLRRDTIDLEAEIELKYDRVQGMIEVNAFSELLGIPLVNSVISFPPDIILDLTSRLLLMCGNNESFTGEGFVDITDTTDSQNTTQNSTQNTPNEQPEENCPICMEKFSNNTVFLECTHRYHRPCIQEWLDNNDNCPVCRQSVGNVDI